VNLSLVGNRSEAKLMNTLNNILLVNKVPIGDRVLKKKTIENVFSSPLCPVGHLPWKVEKPTDMA